jgi:membrane protein required for colicin V production
MPQAGAARAAGECHLARSMSSLSLTAFDVAALLVVAISALLSLVRGATREALTIACWLGAIVAAWYGYGYAQDVARMTIETGWLADAAALVVVFVVPLIAFKVLAALLADHLPEHGAFGTADRIAGVVFGLARGAVLVCAFYVGLTMLIEPDRHPEWIQKATVLPYVQEGAHLITGLLPKDAEESQAAERIQRQGRSLLELGEAARELAGR